MQLPTKVILLYLSVAFCDGLNDYGFLSNLYEDVIESPYLSILSKPKDINRFADNAPRSPYRANVEPRVDYSQYKPRRIDYLQDKPRIDYLPNKPRFSYYVDAPTQIYEKTTPIIPIKDPDINPYNLKYRHRGNNNSPIVAGLDNMRPIDERSCLNDVLRANLSLSSPVECARTCRKGDRRICYYNFIAEYYQVNGLACKLCTPGSTNALCSSCQCVLADGIERTAQLINRQLPGPSIEVCEGDQVVIDVTNAMTGSELTIHWHGVHQRHYPFYDGVPFVTQCPIHSAEIFRYQWGANTPGTQFWHSHSGLQKMDGIFGNLIIRQTPERDLHSRLYDYDLSTHIITINDWMHEESVRYFPGRRFNDIGQLPDTILINGKGRYTDPKTGVTTNATLEVIDVIPGKRYRIRMINAFCTVCPSVITIENHRLTVISTDGRDIEPITVDSITAFSSERYDFILHANRTVGSYWIQVRAVGLCTSNAIQQTAILRYKGAPDKPLLQSPTYSGGLPQGVVLNAMNATCETPMADTICVSSLNSIEPIEKAILEREPDIKYYLPVGFYEYTLQEIFEPNTYNRFMLAVGKSPLNALVDGISFLPPPSPPLSQPLDIPNNVYCNWTNLPENCKEGLCTCTHKLNIPLNSIVEIVLVDEVQAVNLSHPFHMHGYSFYVMGMGRATNVSSINWKIVRAMDEQNKVNRCFDKPVKKDTVEIPYNGYVILRFLADNPGYWLFHCHFIYHQIVGMEVILHVGEPKDLPPVPKDFPKCKNFMPDIGGNVYRRDPPFTKVTHKSRYS